MLIVESVVTTATFVGRTGIGASGAGTERPRDPRILGGVVKDQLRTYVVVRYRIVLHGDWRNWLLG